MTNILNITQMLESALSRIISLKHFLFCAELKIKLIFHNNLQPYTNQDGDECGISMGEPTPTSVYWKDDNVKG
jgi:hypothetical protein